jgi:hypothetical protein
MPMSYAGYRHLPLSLAQFRKSWLNVEQSYFKNKIAMISLVRMRGLEPPRLTALAPKASVSTNSTTSAYDCY